MDWRFTRALRSAAQRIGAQLRPPVRDRVSTGGRPRVNLRPGGRRPWSPAWQPKPAAVSCSALLASPSRAADRAPRRHGAALGPTRATSGSRSADPSAAAERTGPNEEPPQGACCDLGLRLRHGAVTKPRNGLRRRGTEGRAAHLRADWVRIRSAASRGGDPVRAGTQGQRTVHTQSQGEDSPTR
jgi:hypothetical protein